MHRWSSSKFDSPECPIFFGVVPEDPFHFAVGCFDKWQYWCNFFILFDLTSTSATNMISGLVLLLCLLLVVSL